MPRRSYRYEADPYGDSYGGGYGRGGYSDYGYSPYGRRDRIVDLILAGGDIAAQGAQRSGEIWGSAIGQIGQTVGSGLQQYAETAEQERQAKQLAMRDKALVGALESWDGKDPLALFGSLGRIADPKTAMEWTQGALAFQGLTDKADKENAARFQELGKRMASVSYPVFERLWPGVQPKVAPVAEKLMGIPADKVPAEPTQETYETIRQLFGEKSELIKGRPGEVFFDEDGNPKFSVPAAAKEAKKYEVTVPGPDGRPVTRLATEEEMTQGVSEYVKPSEPDKPKWIEGEDSETGERILYDPNTGATKPIPGGIIPKPTTAEANRMASAGAALVASREISDYLGRADVKKEIGPAIGRYNSLMQAAGVGNPVAVQLVGMLRSYSALQPNIHGFRAVQFAQDIERLLTTKQTPEAILAVIKGIDTAAKAVKNRGRSGGQGRTIGRFTVEPE